MHNVNRIALYCIKILLLILTVTVGGYSLSVLIGTLKKIRTGGEFYAHGGNEIIWLVYLLPTSVILLLLYIPFRNVTLKHRVQKPNKISTLTIWLATLATSSYLMHVAIAGLLHTESFSFFLYIYIFGSMGLLLSIGKAHGKTTSGIVGIICISLYLGQSSIISQMHQSQKKSFDSRFTHVSIDPNVKTSNLSKFAGDFSETDPLQKNIIFEMKNPSTPQLKIAPNSPSLRVLSEKKMELLLNYLAACPQWRLRRNNIGSEFIASRRYKIGEYWFNSTQHKDRKEDIFSKLLFPMGKIDLLLGGKINQGILHSEGSPPAAAHISSQPGRAISPFSFGTSNFMVEIRDSDRSSNRRLSQIGVDHLEKEFAQISSSTDSSPCAIKGTPDLLISSEFIHSFTAIYWVNPGEPGTVTISAHEITTNEWVGSSATSGFVDSNEIVGWSKNPNEIFYGSLEGGFQGEAGARGFDKFKGEFLVRYDLVFEPSSGGPARTILSKTYKMKSLW